ncbi:MAG: hypothetical protein ACI376_08875 [Candidatus Bruticola sp.]
MSDSNQLDSEQLVMADKAYAENFSDHHIDGGADSQLTNYETVNHNSTPSSSAGSKSKSKLYLAAVVIISLLCIVAGVFYFFLCSGRGMQNVVLEAARIAPKDCAAVVAVDLRREESLNQAFSIILSSVSNNDITKQAIEKIIPKEVVMDIEKLAEHAEGAGAFILRLRVDNAVSPEVVYIQEFKNGAPITKIMQDMQQRAVKKNPKLKYTSTRVANCTVYYPDNQSGLSWAVRGSELYVSLSGAMLQTILTPREESESMLANAEFTKNIGKIDNNTLSFGFIDIKRIVTDLHIKEAMQQCKIDKEVTDIISSLNNLCFRGDIVSSNGRRVKFTTQLNCDSALYGVYGQRIFNSINNVDFKTLKCHPVSNSSVIGFNLRVIWNLVYVACGLNEETKQYRELPDAMLSRIGYSMDKLFDIFTGECCTSIGGLGRVNGNGMFNESYQNNSNAFLQEIKDYPVIVTLGVKDIQKLNKLLSKIPQLSMSLLLCQSHQVGEYTVYELPHEKGCYFVLGPQYIALAFRVAESKEQFDQLIMGKGQAWDKVPVIAQAANNGQLNGLAISCENIGANRLETAAALAQRISSGDPKSKLLKQAKEACEVMGHSLGYSSFHIYAQKDKIASELIMELSAVPAVPVAEKKENSKNS